MNLNQLPNFIEIHTLNSLAESAITLASQIEQLDEARLEINSKFNEYLELAKTFNLKADSIFSRTSLTIEDGGVSSKINNKAYELLTLYGVDIEVIDHSERYSSDFYPKALRNINQLPRHDEISHTYAFLKDYLDNYIFGRNEIEPKIKVKSEFAAYEHLPYFISKFLNVCLHLDGSDQVTTVKDDARLGSATTFECGYFKLTYSSPSEELEDYVILEIEFETNILEKLNKCFKESQKFAS